MEQPRRPLLALVLVALLAAAAVTWAVLGQGEAGPPRVPAALAGDERVIVEVLNGSGQRGWARLAARALRQAGFDVVYFGTTSEAVPLTRVLARRGDSSAAARVATALGAAQVGVATDTLLRVDVTVLLGSDYRPPPGIRP